MARDKLLNRFQDPLIDLLLRFASGRQVSFRNQEGMIATFDNMKKRWRGHFGADVLEKILRTKWITRALHKEDWGLQGSQNLIAQFRLIAPAAKRVSKTYNGPYPFFE